MAWWDYGYQINGVGQRTTIADGNTWNHEHIALLGRCLISPEVLFCFLLSLCEITSQNPVIIYTYLDIFRLFPPLGKVVEIKGKFLY
jgi:asparagine N-glycosylation enzyme membrane subunit Stt3